MVAIDDEDSVRPSLSLPCYIHTLDKTRSGIEKQSSLSSVLIVAKPCPLLTCCSGPDLMVHYE